MDLGRKTDGEGWGHSCLVESLPGLDEATHLIHSNWGAGGAESLYLLFFLKLNEVSFKNQTLR